MWLMTIATSHDLQTNTFCDWNTAALNAEKCGCIFGGGSGILNHESRLRKLKKSEGIMNHIISQAVNHESWTKK